MNKNKNVRIITGLLILAMVFSLSYIVNGRTSRAAQSAADCATLCKAALKITGNSDKLKYKSESSIDFGALDSSDRKLVSQIIYLCDKKEAYSIAVINTKSTKDAKALYKSLRTYKKNNSKSDYLSDYSADEQKVFKNAVVAKKGTHVWYIAMSGKKSNNKGSKAISKSL